MTDKRLRTVFMGTPDFALPSLQRLFEYCDVCAVFCQPDKACGRGNKVIYGPVKGFALQNNIRICQPETFKNECCKELISELDPELIVVAAYGKILPEYVLNHPKYGCINVHGSLLPKYRGASPIQYAVLNGDKQTGITIMKMAKGIDSGDIISQVKTDIGEYETAGELFCRLSVLGADCLINTIQDIIDGHAVFMPQNDSESTHVSVITKQMGRLDFNDTAEHIKCKVYGLNPWPSAYIEADSSVIKLHRVLFGSTTEAPPGIVVSIGKKGIEVACGDKRTIIITEIQRFGKKKMDAYSFSLGVKITEGMSIYSL